MLLRTVAGFHLAVSENRPIPDSPNRQYAIMVNGDQDSLLNAGANELMAGSLTLPPLSDSVLVNTILAMVHLTLTGDGSYIQSAMHPGVPARELFLSGAVNMSLARINNRCQDEDVRVVFAGINAIFMELLRTCGLASVPAAALPLARSTMWRPEQLVTSRAPNLEARAPADSTMSKDQILAYLRSAIASLTPPPHPAAEGDGNDGNDPDVLPHDFET